MSGKTSEKTISLPTEVVRPRVAYTEFYVKAKMRPLEQGYEGFSLKLHPGDVAWDPQGSYFRGPDVINYSSVKGTGRIWAFPESLDHL